MSAPVPRLPTPKPTADPREERLPQWARKALDEARRERDAAKRERDAARLATAPDESDAVVHPWDAIPVGLGKGYDARVRFKVGDQDRDEWADVHVVRTRQGSYLEVMGGTGLRISPQSSNVVKIEVTR